MDDELAWMALAEIAGLAGRDSRALADAAATLGSARALVRADGATLRRLGMSARGAATVRGFDGWHELERRRERCERLGVRIAAFAAAAYPGPLRFIPDPPLVLYYRGAPPGELGSAAVAVVGSRRASRYGLRVAERVGERLAEAGVVVASGLARGIDAAAHEGALRAGSAVAVLAGGLDRVYPARNRRLCERIVDRGSVVSESPPGTPTRPYLFPVRNRIITGMSVATLIIEAAERSGSLISARLAAEQGRDVLAVPGNIDSAASAGANGLIRDGAAPLLDVEPILAACGIERSAASKPLPGKDFGTAEGAAIVAALDPAGTHLEEIADTVGLDGARIMELLTALELGGFVERLPGGRFAPSGALFAEGAGPRTDGDQASKGDRAGKGGRGG